MDLVWIIILVLIGLFLGWMSTTGSKTQWVRLLDIFFFGPILIYVGIRESNLALKVILILMGASTMSYNLRNYWAAKHEISDILI